MPVRNTESRIPGGFSTNNIKRFGEAANNGTASPNYALISYLSSPIRRIPGSPFWNKYVVFVDTSSVSNSQTFSYNWTIEFLDATNNQIPQMASIAVSTQTGILDFNSSAYYPDDTILDVAAFCRISVTVNLITLTLSHAIVEPLQSITDLLGGTLVGPGGINLDALAIYGNSATTAALANLYREYILESVNIVYSETLKIPANLVAAVSYLNIYQNGRNENAVLEQNLNNPPADWNADAANKDALGVGILKPHFAAMFIPQNGQSGAPYLTFQELDQLQVSDPEQAVFDQFVALPADQRLDIYNLLRFPKSGIQHCAFVLNKLKNSNTAWTTFEKNDLADQGECVKSIVSELTAGPFQGLPDFSLLGKKTYQISWSPYILKIVEPVLYKLIKIKVLDIRSGRPVTDAKLKKLVIEAEVSGNQTFRLSQEFDYDKSSIQESAIQAANGLVQEAQRALFRLGHYAQNTPTSVVDGSWDAASTDAYNAFWQAHTLDNSFDHAGTAAPADERLRFIIDEYNDHGFTNDAGILNIRVPMAFLADKKVRLEIGFFEFPVVLEKRKLDATDTHAITRRLNPLGTLSEDDTGFIIRWEGQDAQGNVIQTTDWDRNKNWDNTAVSPQKGHFGWQVEDVPDVPSAENTDFLRVCLKLPIKDDFQPYAGLNANLLSNFYDANTYPYHFVVFGMQWCQPMWQLLPATTTHWVEGPIHPGNDVPLGLSTQINPDERTKPAICTMYDAAADRSGQGRDYGANVFYHGQTGSQGTPVNDTTHFTPAELPLVFKLLDFGPTRYYAPRSRGHHGIDYHAINHTTPVFAPYGSKVIFASRINGYGKVLQFKVEKSGNIFLMAHLSENHNYAVALNDVVMAGRHVARAGRTDSNTVMNSYYTDGPTHVHLEISQSSSYHRRVADPRNIVQLIDATHDVVGNRDLFLNNYSLRLFPCDCHGGESIDATNHVPGSDCAIRLDTGGTSTHVSSRCWASRNLHCPYLRPLNFNTLPATDQERLNTFRMQAQLTYLYEDDANQPPDPYLNPNGIDGSWGVGAQDAIRRFRWKHRLAIYTTANMPANEAGTSGDAPTEGDATWNELNNQAPYPRTNLNRVDK